MDHSTDQTGSELFSKRYGKKEPCIQTNEKERGTTMEIKEAVIKAQNGDQSAFSFLYEETYKSKYYLALKYMKNKEAAEDVLQDAYLKAFSKLGTLKQPEAFEGWLGMIVANTAKNMLVKKNPLLFSEMAVDQEGEEYVYDVEDEDPENQPELAYTREETKELVHVLLDGLSEEQRMAILMFHLENASISEIAQAMECSENTVKSRLNYGRKNLKIQAEQLQKKGYKLYAVAPVLLLVYLLRNDRSVMAADKAFLADGKAMETKILQEYFKNTAKTTGKINNAKAVNTAGKAAAKSAVKGSIVNKIAAIAVAVGVLGGSAYGIIAWNNQRNQTAQMATATTNNQNSTQNTSTIENKTSSATTEATTEQPKQKVMISDVYKKVLTDVENGKYEFPDAQGNTDYYYFVRDMNKDGIKELIVAPRWSVNEYTNYDIRVFSCTNSEEGYKLSVISEHEWVSNISTNGGVCLPSNGNGLLIHNFTKGTGESDVHRLTIQNGKLVYGDTEQTFSMGDSEWDSFAQENPEATWTAISDKSKIEELQ